MTEVLAQASTRQRELFARLQTQYLGSTRVCREIWAAMSAPADEPLFRLFFEVYGLALQDRKRFATFLKRVVAPWLDFIGEPLVQRGWTPQDATAYATLVTAGFRGFMLDLCATRDRERVNRAVELWLRTLSAAGAESEAAS